MAGIWDIRPDGPGDFRTMGEEGPVTIIADPAIFELIGIDPVVTAGGVGVTIVADPAIFELVGLNATVIVDGPITIQVDPAIFELVVPAALVFGGGRQSGNIALLQTVGL